MNKLTQVISLLLTTCFEFPSGVNSQAPPPAQPPPPMYDGTSRYNEVCNLRKNKICWKAERTSCIPDDPSRPFDQGKCLCKQTQAFILFIEEQTWKVYDHPLPNDVSDIDPVKLAAIQPYLVQRCGDYKIVSGSCDPPYPLPVPQGSKKHIHPLNYHLMPATKIFLPGDFENRGCMSHETQLICQAGRCVCPLMVNPMNPMGPQYFTEQNPQGVCEVLTGATARFHGENCSGKTLVCFPHEEVVCDGPTKTCICKDPNKEWFMGGSGMPPITNFYAEGIDGRCVPTRRHNTPCDPNPKAFDWCSRKLGLKCYEGFCKCQMYPQMVWLNSERRCLRAEGQPCMSHESCAEKFCHENTCKRQMEQGAPCETGLDQQCSSGFCDKKVCRYRVNPTTSLGNRLESFNMLSIILLMLPVTTDHFPLI